MVFCNYSTLLEYHTNIPRQYINESTWLYSNKTFCSSGQCGSVAEASSHIPKGHRFNSWSGHMPRLWVWSLLGARGTYGRLPVDVSHWYFSLSPFLSLSISTNKTKNFVEMWARFDLWAIVCWPCPKPTTPLTSSLVYLKGTLNLSKVKLMFFPTKLGTFLVFPVCVSEWYDQVRNLEVILDTSLSLTFHIWSVTNSCWFYLVTVSLVLSMSTATNFIQAPLIFHLTVVVAF